MSMYYFFGSPETNDTWLLQVTIKKKTHLLILIHLEQRKYFQTDAAWLDCLKKQVVEVCLL